MTPQEEFEQQYEALNAYPAGFMLARRLADAYSEQRETRAYRWFVRGRSFGYSREEAESVTMADKQALIDFGFKQEDWIAIGSLMGWIPEKEK